MGRFIFTLVLILCFWLVPFSLAPANQKDQVSQRILRASIQLVRITEENLAPHLVAEGLVVNNLSGLPVFYNIATREVLNALDSDQQIQLRGYDYLKSVAASKNISGNLDFSMSATIRNTKYQVPSDSMIKYYVTKNYFHKIAIPIYLVLQSKTNGSTSDIRDLEFKAVPDVSGGVFPGFRLLTPHLNQQVGYLLLKFDPSDSKNPKKNFIILNFMDYELGLPLERLVVLGMSKI